MIKTAPFIVNASQSQPTDKRPWLAVLLSRLLLLGIGSGVGWIVGAMAATSYPNPHPEMPLALKMLERIKTGTQPASSANPPNVAAVDGAGSPTNRAQAQQLMAQVQQLQGELQALRDRTQALETALGSPRPTEPLETRLLAIAQQLQAAPQAGTPPLANGTTNQPSADSQPESQAEVLKVTLPSDMLFEENESTLSSGANVILEKVYTDLRSYPKATINVAVHTDNTGQPEDSRELSFQRAKALEQYLSTALGNSYRLVVIGYGASRPLVPNNTDADRQRNRRVEIIVNE